MLNQTRAVAQKYGSKALVLASTLPLAMAARAQAGADPFAEAVTNLTAKVTEYGGALVVFSAVAVGFWVAMKYVKKIPKAA